MPGGRNRNFTGAKEGMNLVFGIGCGWSWRAEGADGGDEVSEARGIPPQPGGHKQESVRSLFQPVHLGPSDKAHLANEDVVAPHSLSNFHTACPHGILPGLMWKFPQDEKGIDGVYLHGRSQSGGRSSSQRSTWSLESQGSRLG